jgi:hypothetical protein
MGGEVVGLSEKAEGRVRDTEAENDDEDCEELGKCQYICRGFPVRHWAAWRRSFQEWRRKWEKLLRIQKNKRRL